MKVIEKKHQATIVRGEDGKNEIRLLDQGVEQDSTDVDIEQFKDPELSLAEQEDDQHWVMKAAAEVGRVNENAHKVKLNVHDVGDKFDIIIRYLE